MLKIKDIEVGAMYDLTLVVKSATARETKAKKPYLAIEFFDGTTTINANYWDWASGNIPKANTILDVKAQVTEWQGVKQLNVKSMKDNTTASINDFAPTSEFDIGESYKGAYALLSDVMDDTLRTIGLAALEELRTMWLHVPGAVSVHHNFVGGTLVHSYHTARIAAAIADSMEGVNKDLVVVGAMLHDIGKLFTYTINGVTITKTNDGRLYEHLFIGAEFIGNFADSHVDTDDPAVYAKVRLLRHIILAHHGELTYGSPVTPACMEAYIVHYADALDATGEQLRMASKAASETTAWSDKLWTLHNSQHLTSHYMNSVMES